MLLHESRRETRATPDGELILLDEQDRSRWNRALIDEGAALVRAALRPRNASGPYAMQAAIAAVHAEAPSAADTDWREIVGPLRPAAADHALAHRRAQPHRGARHA